MRGVMVHRATVQRVPAEAPKDAWGHQDASAKAVTIRTDLPCYAWHDDDAVDVRDGQKNAVVGLVKLLVPADADVSVADLFVDISDRAGRVIIAGPVEVIGVAQKGTHLQLRARQVRHGEGR